MPVVPRIDSPPSIPSRGLKVLAAISLPPGTLISTRTPRRVTSRMAAQDHLPRHGIDGRLARRHLEPRLGDRADALAGNEGRLRGVVPGKRDPHFQPVGYVRVVAGVFADGRRDGRGILARLDVKNRQANRLAGRQTQIDLARRGCRRPARQAAALAAAAAQAPVVMPRAQAHRPCLSFLRRQGTASAGAATGRFAARASATVSGMASSETGCCS